MLKNPRIQEDKKNAVFLTPDLSPIREKIPRHVNHKDFSEKLNIGGYPDFEDFYSRK